jgi:hypothetical protein
MHNHWYSKGKLHIVWYTGKEGTPGIYYAVSSDKGETFSKPLPIFNGTWVPPLKSSLAVDRYNNTWIAWEDIAELEKNNSNNSSCVNHNHNYIIRLQTLTYNKILKINDHSWKDSH